MTSITEIEQGIESLLAEPPYGVDSGKRRSALLELLKKEIAYATERSPGFRNLVEHWPVDFHSASEISDLPYLPVGVFKANPPLALVPQDEVKRTLTSSATTGRDRRSSNMWLRAKSHVEDAILGIERVRAATPIVIDVVPIRGFQPFQPSADRIVVVREHHRPWIAAAFGLRELRVVRFKRRIFPPRSFHQLILRIMIQSVFAFLDRMRCRCRQLGSWRKVAP